MTTETPDQSPAQESGAPLRYILLDTNCFLRLYHSPLRPFLGAIVGDYKLLTLETLVQEFLQSKRLRENYAWALQDMQAEDLSTAALHLSDDEKKLVEGEKIAHEAYVQSVISTHCTRRNITVRSLSGRDMDLLATTIAFRAIVATDEWPLQFVIADLLSIPDEYEMLAYTTVDVLHLLEKEGKISADDRRATVRAWLQYDEKLPRNWRDIYRTLFGEKAPTLQ